MDFESAWEAAIRMLDERGQLLNGHLFRLVEGNDQLFRQIRTRLIDDGIAEDRSGAGLIRSSTPLPISLQPQPISQTGIPTRSSAESDSSSSGQISSADLQLDGRIHMPDWWLMSGGVIRGPMDLVTLCTLKQQGEIRSADVVRQGLDGFWQRPDDVPLLAALVSMNLEETEFFGGQHGVRPGSRATTNGNAANLGSSSANGPLTAEDSGDAKPYVIPDKSWSIQKQRSNWILRTWHSAAALVGGTRRLYALFAVICLCGVFVIWWRQPPPSKAIFQEFTQIRGAVRRLQEKRAPRSEFDIVSARYRPRVKGVADRLKRVATEDRPLENALYNAAVGGLIPMLDNPMAPGSSIREFEIQMERANKLLEAPRPSSS